MIYKRKFIAPLALAVTLIVAVSCSKEISKTTGWEYNNPKNGAPKSEIF